MQKIRKREEVKREDTWAIEDLYETNELCREDIRQVEEQMEEFLSFKGRLGESGMVLKEALDRYYAINQKLDRIYVFASQKLHQDMGNGVQQSLEKTAQILMNKFYAACSFLDPEILKIPEENLKAWIEEVPGLKLYEYAIHNILLEKAHTLDEKTEELLARAREMGSAADNIFAMFNNADIRFEEVVDKDGNRQPLTVGLYGSYLKNQDRVLRKEAFEKLYKVYRQFNNTLAATYDANLRSAYFFAKEHKYDSAREASLADNHIPVPVYDNLLEAVNKNLPFLHRYMEIRKKTLHLEELHMYDLYVPMVDAVDMEYSFHEAKEIVLKAMVPLGEDYLALLKEGFENRWIDVYENVGKRTGAYSWGAYGVHPYVLLNYHGSLNDVFTLAHEMGHALHTWHSDQKQPFPYAGYSIFVAEVASTLNEALLINYLLKNSKDVKERAYLVNYFLEQFRTTLYRQTMFAEFEKETHEIVNQGGALTAEKLNEIYLELNKRYFGEAAVCDQEIAYEWSKIPHFYTPFYVYQYATGFSAAIAISNKILKGETGIVEKYKEFLGGGSSMTPIELLRICGVDMASKEPVESALGVFAEYLDIMEEILKEMK